MISALPIVYVFIYGPYNMAPTETQKGSVFLGRFDVVRYFAHWRTRARIFSKDCENIGHWIGKFSGRSCTRASLINLDKPNRRRWNAFSDCATNICSVPLIRMWLIYSLISFLFTINKKMLDHLNRKTEYARQYLSHKSLYTTKHPFRLSLSTSAFTSI